MKPSHLLTIARVALTAGVFASAALLKDYENPGDPAFCSATSTCMKVRTSDVGMTIAKALYDIYPGLMLPHVGLFALLALMAVTFFLRTRLHAYVLAALSAGGALFAAFLIYAQASISTFCLYCMIVDVCVLVNAAATAGIAFGAARSTEVACRCERCKQVSIRKPVPIWKQLFMDVSGKPLCEHCRASLEHAKPVVPQDEGLLTGVLDPSILRATEVKTVLAWAVAGTIVTALPYVWARFPHSALPPQIAAMQTPGKKLVVTFTDFQCPYCRRLHLETHEKLAARPDVQLKRVMVPLPSHPGAMPAALAFTCTPPEKQEAVADALYKAEPSELTYAGVVEILAKEGVQDSDALVECMGNSETQKKIEADGQLFDAIGGEGLPTTFVGNTKVKGALSETVLNALDRQAAPEVELPVWLLFVCCGLVVLGVVAWTERQSRGALITAPPIAPPPPDGDDDREEEEEEEEEEIEGASDSEKPSIASRDEASSRERQ